EQLIEDRSAIAGLEYMGDVGQVKQSLIHRYRYPPQEHALRPGISTRDPRTQKAAGEIVAIDPLTNTIDLKRSKSRNLPHPAALVPFDYIPEVVLQKRLMLVGTAIAARGLDGAGFQATIDLLRAVPPRVSQPAREDLRGAGEEALDAARRLVLA